MNSGHGSGARPTNEKQATSIAWAIAKAIKKRGIQGDHMFDLAFEQLKTEAPGILEREIAVALEAAGFGGKQPPKSWPRSSTPQQLLTSR